MLSAFVLPKILDKFPDRSVMLTGTTILVIGLFSGSLIASYNGLLALWFVLGIGYSVSQTPTGRLIRKSASSENRTSLFAAQFAFSHACWLITYPLVGWLSTNIGHYRLLFRWLLLRLLLSFLHYAYGQLKMKIFYT
jgi:MFS family permease